MNGEENELAIVPVANGFIVRGAYSFMRNRASNDPPEWFAFESFGAMVEHLRKVLAEKPTRPA